MSDITQPVRQIDRTTEAAYFRNVDSFGKSRLRWATRSAGAAWCVAIVAGAIAGAEGFAIAEMSTRPPPEPVVLRVDNATGLVDRIYNTEGAAPASEAEARHWLWQFVRAAESYSFPEARLNFDTVAMMSVPSVQKWHADRVGGGNPLAPSRVLGRDGQAVLNWESTTFIGNGLAQVRFTQTDRKGDNVLPARHMVATIGYRFATGPVSGATLNVNPRGFLVTTYAVEQEGAR